MEQRVARFMIITVVVFTITVFMNTMFRPAGSFKPIKSTIAIQKEIPVVTKESPSIFSNYSNNEKVALFLAIPLGGMIWTGFLAMRKIKIDSITERQPRVVF